MELNLRILLSSIQNAVVLQFSKKLNTHESIQRHEEQEK